MSPSTRITPIFVVGSPRSGTTLLSGLLNQFGRVHITRESGFIPNLYRPEFDTIDQWTDAELRKLLGVIDSWLSPNGWQRRTNIADLKVFQEVYGIRGYAGLIMYVWQIEDAVELTTLTYLGDNTPRYIMAIPLLNQLFPTARYVHIVRDGRDVVCSVRDKRFGGNSLLVAARSWMEQIGCWQLAERIIPADRRLELRYEDLVRDPTAHRRHLADFLQLDAPTDDATTQPASRDLHGLARLAPHHARLSQPIDDSSVGRYRRELGSRQLAHVESVMYPALVAYDYPVGPYRPSLTMLERNALLTGSHLADLSTRLFRKVARCR